MKHKEIRLLLGILLVFSGLLGIYHHVKTEQVKSALQGLSAQSSVAYLSPAVASGSVEVALDQLKTLPKQELQAIIADLVMPGIMERFDALELLSALALHYKDDTEIHKQLFGLIIKHKHLQEGKPVLCAVAKSLYTKAIPLWIAWNKSQSEQLDLVASAYNFAIDQNNSEPFAVLQENGASIETELAKKLVWRVINEQRSGDFIAPLAAAGAPLDAQNDAQKTPLIVSAEFGNYELCKALLDAGADVNAMPSPQIGTALQAAIENGFGQLANYLRQRGARE